MGVDADLRQRREAVIQEHVTAENAHDMEGVVGSFDRPRYEPVPLRLYDGAEGVREFMRSNWGGFSDWRADITSLRHAEDLVLVEAQMTGTHDGAWSGFPPTGRRIDVPCCCLFFFEEDRLVCERVYADILTILQQLGLVPEEPSALAMALLGLRIRWRRFAQKRASKPR